MMQTYVVHEDYCAYPDCNCVKSAEPTRPSGPRLYVSPRPGGTTPDGPARRGQQSSGAPDVDGGALDAEALGNLGDADGVAGHEETVAKVLTDDQGCSDTHYMTKSRYTVRKQSSGYSSSETFVVWKRGGGRVTVNAHRTREAAQAEADVLNISDMVKDYADDPRPYAERLAEATAAYAASAAIR